MSQVVKKCNQKLSVIRMSALLVFTTVSSAVSAQGTGTVLQFQDCIENGQPGVGAVRGPCDLLISPASDVAFVHLHGSPDGLGAGEEHEIFGNLFANVHVRYRGVPVYREGANGECWSDEHGRRMLCIFGASAYYTESEFESVPLPPYGLPEDDPTTLDDNYQPMPPNNSFLNQPFN